MANQIELGQPAAAAALPPLADKPVYMEILERVQEVWNAFIACITDLGARFFNWCASWIVTPIAEPKPEPKPIEEKKAEVEAEPATQEALVEWYRSTLIADYQGRVTDHRFGEPKALIERYNQIFLVASPYYTNARQNYTARLLRLGADANSVDLLNSSITPLRCAALTGGLLAYITLRQAGANQHKLYGGVLDRGESTMELLYRMQTSPLSVCDFFRQEVPENQTPYTLFTGGMGSYYGRMNEDQFGTKEDIARMIDYEVRKIFAEIDPTLGGVFPKPLVKLVAEHLTLEAFK